MVTEEQYIAVIDYIQTNSPLEITSSNKFLQMRAKNIEFIVTHQFMMDLEDSLSKEMMKNIAEKRNNPIGHAPTEEEMGLAKY